ncbi:MFS transporter [Solitalea longa]|uniref:MFS transporter n=1 Tax=Solitalea longa TaxID=2079460 RepID=A0A2S4ZXR0_9SPHI|nr:MFS transporter [Solitalea longa]POY35140.1 MFS transporter [Solitalea longa]
MGGALLLSLKNKSPKSWYRVSVAAHYFIYGLVFASWASRIPDIKQALGMNEAELGGVLFFIPIGQMTGMALSGWLVSKFGSKNILMKGAVLYPSMLVLLGLASTVWQLSMGLFLFGISSNLFNISVNTQAVGVERLYKGSIMASFHGLWSLAGFMGGLISTLMVALYISPFLHFCIILLFALLILITMSSSVLPRDEQRSAHNDSTEKKQRKKFKLPNKQVFILGLIAFGSLVCEGTMFDWSSVYFEEVINPPQNLVRLGYIAAMFSMAGGRFAADSLITRFGVVNILKLSGATIASGLLLSTVFPTLPTATLGFFLIGLGVSAIVPVTYSLAGRSKTMQPSVAIAIVSSIGFLGFLLGPPVIGFIAHATSLRWAIGSIAIIAIFITFIAPQLKKES